MSEQGNAARRDAILRRYGLGEADLLGAGSESRVYALDDARVLRIPRTMPANGDATGRLKQFLGTIAGRLPFATPEIAAIEPDGVTIEKRLPGRPMTEVLAGIGGTARRTALGNYFDAAAAVGRISMPAEPFGHLIAGDPIRAADWTGFLGRSFDRAVARHHARLAASLGDVDALAAAARDLLTAMPPRPTKVLAHGDIFPGNVMMDETLSVTALVDFGTWTVVAEPDYDIAGATMFAEITDGCGPDDCAFLRSLLLDTCGAGALPALTFYRAYFAFAFFGPPDATGLYPKLEAWNIATLTALGEGRLAEWAET